MNVRIIQSTRHVLAGFLLAIATMAVGQPPENRFLPASGGNWSAPENWSLNHAPTIDEWALIQAGTDADKLVTFDVLELSHVYMLTLGGDGVTPFGVRLDQPAGSLIVEFNEYLGVYGYAEHHLAGRAFLSAGYLHLGFGSDEYPEPFPGYGALTLNTDPVEDAGISVSNWTMGVNGWATVDHQRGIARTGFLIIYAGEYWLHARDLSSQLIATDQLNVNGNSRFLHDGGLADVSGIDVSDHAYFRLSEEAGPAVLRNRSAFWIGAPPARFEHLAGSATCENVMIMYGGGTDPEQPAEYLLAGGTFDIEFLRKEANSQFTMTGGRFTAGEILNLGGAIHQSGGLAEITNVTNTAPATVTLDGTAECGMTNVTGNGTFTLRDTALLRERTGDDPAVGCRFSLAESGQFRAEGGRFRGTLQTDGDVVFTGGDFSAARIAGGVHGNIMIDGALTCERLYSAATVELTQRGSITPTAPAPGSPAIQVEGALLLTGGSIIDAQPGDVLATNLIVIGSEPTAAEIVGSVRGDRVTLTSPASLVVHGAIEYVFIETAAGGTGPGEYSTIVTDGAVSGAVEFRLSLVGGYEPELGDLLTPIHSSGVPDISSFRLPALRSGLAWDTQVTDGGVQLLVIEREPCPGDVNNDFTNDLNDLALLLSHFGMTEGATLGDGDLNGDGAVDLSDLTLLLNEFGKTCG